jgi:hypothetical protein
MNNYDEIKSLLNASRRIIGGSLQESQNNDILRKHRLITEEEDINMGERKDEDVIDDKKDSDEIGTPKDKQRGYKIQGNVLILHGEDETDLELTSDEKNAFIESVDEFRNDVAELVEFGKMNVYKENVEWNGKVLELNLEFFYTVNEPHGIYVNGEMVKLDQEYIDMVGKLQSNYEKFKTKWTKIVASRQNS